MAIPKRLKRVFGVSDRSLYDPIRLTSVCQLEKKLIQASRQGSQRKKETPRKKYGTLLYSCRQFYSPYYALNCLILIFKAAKVSVTKGLT